MVDNTVSEVDAALCGRDLLTVQANPRDASGRGERARPAVSPGGQLCVGVPGPARKQTGACADAPINASECWHVTWYEGSHLRPEVAAVHVFMMRSQVVG